MEQSNNTNSRWSYIKPYVTLKNVIAVVFIVVLMVVISRAVTTDWLRDLVDGLGPFGPLGVVLYVVVSHILTPVAGSPGIVMSVGLFGIGLTMVLTYIGGLVSSIIAFYISKRFGRPVVQRLVGEDTLHEVDGFIDAFDEKLLIIARLLGFPIFDVISYAAGLTPLSFKRYFIITAIVSAIPSFTVNYLFQFSDFNSPVSVLGILFVFVAIGSAFVWYLKGYISRYKKQKDQSSQE